MSQPRPYAHNNDLALRLGNVEFKMIHVEGGTFKMGFGSHEHNVMLTQNYYIGETPVTQELWKAVMGSNPSSFKGEKLPVESVSWNDCQDFIKKLNQKTGMKFRLLTEAEWEFAARGGDKSNHTQYSGSNNLDEVGWYNSNSSGTTHPVKTKNPNELGIYDMSGNVWEWCQDRYDSYSKSLLTYPIGPTSGICRAYRGGGWRYVAGRCRSSFRNNGLPGYRQNTLGLRLALSE